ncbi:hypothetical protein [Falsiroseomonas oryziterrae]|uniref:hypothetical protein n=1 Tax=Falsiroseomonas oryziterrae TaxID=2911368 RepID=UPI001F3CA003|nr:hypothetical protein [Roseomonas sp. NPKOSM-4]
MRDVLDVRDAVAAWRAAWRHIDGAAGGAFNLGGGPHIPVAGPPDHPQRETVPRRPLRRRRMKTGDLARQPTRRDPQRVHQLHDLDVDVVCRVGRPVVQRQEARRVRHRREQGQQLWLGPDGDVPRDGLQRAHQPHELDRVAEPVVAAHQDAAPVQRAAVPNGLEMARERPVARALPRS